MKNDVLSKTLVSATIFLLISVIITPIITGNNFVDDITPPITTHTLDPPEPDGDNGWYVSDVLIILTATDDMSGVKEIRYKVDGGSEQVIHGNHGTFVLDTDKDNLPVEYWAIDNVGNEETHHTFTIDMDQTDPVIDLIYEYTYEGNYIIFIFTATATDETSKMNRVKFLVEDEIKAIIYGPGPEYIWEISFDIDYVIKGFIRKINITDEYVKFYAILVRTSYDYDTNLSSFRFPIAFAYDNAGNYKYDEIILPGVFQQPLSREMFKWYTFSNNYSGYIGNYYIDACFEDKPIKVTPGNINFRYNKLNNRLSTGSLFLRFLDHFPLIYRLLDIWRYALL